MDHVNMLPGFAAVKTMEPVKITAHELTQLVRAGRAHAAHNIRQQAAKHCTILKTEGAEWHDQYAKLTRYAQAFSTHSKPTHHLSRHALRSVRDDAVMTMARRYQALSRIKRLMAIQWPSIEHEPITFYYAIKDLPAALTKGQPRHKPGPPTAAQPLLHFDLPGDTECIGCTIDTIIADTHVVSPPPHHGQKRPHAETTITEDGDSFLVEDGPERKRARRITAAELIALEQELASHL